MIRINSYLHREELLEIIRRWMYSDVHPADAGRVTRLVHFNQEYIARYLREFAVRLFRGLFGMDPVFQPVTVKGELKDCLVARPPYRNERIDRLIRDYAAFPGHYFRETPFDGWLVFVGREDPAALAGSMRIKRDRRLAEKAARRITDRIFDRIRAHADQLAEARARRLGIQPGQLVTTPEDMRDEFLRAEARLLENLRHRQAIEDGQPLAINDVAGLKLILPGDRLGELESVLASMNGCSVLEKEQHTGHYNAVNYIVRLEPPREALLAEPLSAGVVEILKRKGDDPEAAAREFLAFVRSGEPDVHLEIIVSDYQETLESEIGRCMHEDRIIEQRLRREYRGSMAKNMEYLLEYLFAFAASPRRELETLPVKLWDRYLPDYFDGVLKALYGIPGS